MIKDLTAAEVREILDYNPHTGVLTWKKTKSRRIRPGTVAGCVTSQGYIRLCVFGRHILAHRLAYLIMTGEWPEDLIDHKNGKRFDNRWCNLRPSTACLNQRNRTRTWGKVGYLGVTMSGKRFRADITHNGRTKYIGLFDTAEEAHMAYVAQKQIHHPHAHIAQ